MARSGNFNISYGQDLTIFRTINKKISIVLLLAVIFCIPLVAGYYVVYLLNFVFIAMIAVLGLQIVTGYTGQISLGHGAFVAVGAYATAILANYGLPFWVAIPLAGIITMLVGLLVGLPTARLEGLYLAISTLAFQIILLYGIAHGGRLTGGNDGLTLPKASIGGFAFDNPHRFYYLAAGLAIIFVFLATNLVIRSRFGRALVAIRDRDIAASSIGINLVSYKVMAFGVSAFYAGIAGSLYGYMVAVVTPDHFGIDLSIQYLAMLISGGIARIEGALLGAVFITLLPEVMRTLVSALSEIMPTLAESFQLLQEGMYGLVIIVFLLFEPEGLYGFWKSIRNFWNIYPYKYRG